MKYYTIFVARETFFTQEVEAESEDHLYVGAYRVLSEHRRSQAPDEVIRVEEDN